MTTFSPFRNHLRQMYHKPPQVHELKTPPESLTKEDGLCSDNFGEHSMFKDCYPHGRASFSPFEDDLAKQDAT